MFVSLVAIVASDTKKGDDEMPKKEHPKTTYYNSFPAMPRPECSLAHVFWVVNNDHRPLSRGERRNVVYPAKHAGLIEDAPRNQLGVKQNRHGETSRSGFILSDKGVEYFEKCVKPILPTGFKSDAPQPKTRRRLTEISTEDLKRG